MAGERTLTIRFVGDAKNLSRITNGVNADLEKTGSVGSRVLGQIRGHATEMAAGAAAAVGVFAVSAFKAFQDTAIEAGKFADAAGISVEAASRWSEVAGDLGIEAGNVQSAIMRMNQGLAAGKPVFDDFADAIVRTADGNVNAEASFQNLITRIGAIEDPTLRAKAAQDAFGRGYGEMAELMEMSADDLKAALEGVSEAKIIDEDELRKAKESRARLDELKDTFEDLQLSIGEMVSSLTPALTKLADIAASLVEAGTAAAEFALGTDSMSEAFEDFEDSTSTAESRIKDLYNASLDAEGAFSAFGDIIKSVDDIMDDSPASHERWKNLVEVFEDLRKTSPKMAKQMLDDMQVILASSEAGVKFSEDLREDIGLTRERYEDLRKELSLTADTLDDTSDAMGDAAESTETFTGTFETAADVARKYERAAKDAADQTYDLEGAIEATGDAYDKLKGKFDDRAAWDNANDAAKDLMETVAGGEASWDELRRKTDDYTLALADVVLAMDDLPEEVRTELITQLDAGQVDLVRAQLDALAKTRTAEFRIMVEQVTSGEIKQMENRLNRDINGNGVIGRAKGGPVWPGGVFAVGDNPDGSWNRTTELFVPNTAGSIMSAADSRAAIGGGGGSNVYITVNVPPTVDKGAVGREIAESLLAYQRESGPVFVTTRS